MKKSVVRKIFSSLTLLSLIALSGCKAKLVKMDQKVNILASFFPEWDWTQQIVGNSFNSSTLSMLQKDGTVFHDYKPDENDLIQIKNCDFLIYTGLPEEEWITEEINKTGGPKKVLNLNELLLQNGTPGDHFWFCIENVKIICKEICNILCELDPPNQENYLTNLESYIEKLTLLDQEYTRMVKAAPQKTIILCDRNPFGTLFDYYGIEALSLAPDCYSPMGGSDQIKLLTKKMDELDAKYVFKLSYSKDTLSHEVIKNSKNKMADTLNLNSMETVKLTMAFNGKTYIGIMTENLGEIRKALYNEKK